MLKTTYTHDTISDTFTVEMSAGHIVLTDTSGFPEVIFLLVRIVAVVHVERDLRGNLIGELFVMRKETAAVRIALG